MSAVPVIQPRLTALLALGLCACAGGGESSPGVGDSDTPSAAQSNASESQPATQQAGAATANTDNSTRTSQTPSGNANAVPSAGNASAAPGPTASTSAGNAASAAASAGVGATDSGAAGAAANAAGAAANAAGADASMNAATTCDRACLTGWNDAYLDALIANDASKLDTAPDVRFTENGKELQLTEGLWAVARELGPYRQDMAEVPAGQTAGFVSLKDNRGDVLLAFRLKVVAQKVTEIETTVCRSGEATFFSPANLMHNPLYDEEVEPSARLPREEMIKIVDSYFNGIETSDGSAIPFSDTARRNENGAVTGMGTGLKNVAMFSYIETIERRYVLVDEERGNVLPWVLFQIPQGLTGSRTLHLAELFKVDGAMIQDVQAIMVNQPFGTPGGWE